MHAWLSPFTTMGIPSPSDQVFPVVLRTPIEVNTESCACADTSLLPEAGAEAGHSVLG